MFLRVFIVWVIVCCSGVQLANAQNFRLNKLKQDYSNKAREVKMSLAGLIDDPSSSSKSRWVSKCKDALNSLGKFEDKILNAEGKKWKADQVEAWNAVSQIGSGIADTNDDLEEALGDMRKALLQSRRDAKTFLAKCDKAVSKDINGVNEFLKKWLNDTENWNKIFRGVKDGEFGGDLDDDIQGMLKYKKDWDSFRRAASATNRLYEGTYEFLYESKKKQFDKCTDDIRIQRRRLERLVRLKMDPNGEKFFGEFEEAIEEAALSRLDIYQELLDDWVDINRPFEDTFDEFIAEAVGPLMLRAGKLIPKAILGHSLPSHLYSPDGTLDSLLDTVGEFFKTAPKYYLKEGKESLEISILEAEQKHEEDLEALDIRLESRVSRATENSEKDVEAWRKSMKTKAEELQRAERGTQLFELIQSQIEGIVEEMNLEPAALEKEIAMIKRKIADEQRGLVEKHETRIGEIRKAIREFE
jgi:hypothetical protein